MLLQRVGYIWLGWTLIFSMTPLKLTFVFVSLTIWGDSIDSVLWWSLWRPASMNEEHSQVRMFCRIQLSNLFQILSWLQFEIGGICGLRFHFTDPWSWLYSMTVPRSTQVSAPGSLQKKKTEDQSRKKKKSGNNKDKRGRKEMNDLIGEKIWMMLTLTRTH